MSRSALDRLEQKKAAEAWKRQQEMIWQQHQYGHIQDDDQEKKRNELPMVGNSMSTFNLNKMLYNCIEDNEYFQKIRYALTDFQQITEEVAQRVTHVEPWSTGTSRVPSTASNATTGLGVGASVGALVGAAVGGVGFGVGAREGRDVGVDVGAGVGATVGDALGQASKAQPDLRTARASGAGPQRSPSMQVRSKAHQPHPKRR